MMITKRAQWRLRLFFTLVAITSMGGPLYASLFGAPFDSFVFPGNMLPSLIGGAVFWGFEILWVPSRRGRFVRHLPFIWAVLVRVVLVSVIVTILAPVANLYFNGVFDPLFSFKLGPSIYLFVSSIVFILYSISQVVRIIGPRVMANIIFGRYHRPRREDRVFLFLDIKGSTALSEELGDIGVQEMIARFFADISEPILEWGGEVHRYIGDEVVIMWTLHHGIKNANCLRCCFAIQDHIKDRAPYYQQVFGTVPEFRIGLHGGTVVAAQCGDIKQEIVFFGDTINTAARIEQYCKEANRELLISDDLYDKLPESNDWSVEPIGSVLLRGRRHKTGLIAVSKN